MAAGGVLSKTTERCEMIGQLRTTKFNSDTKVEKGTDRSRAVVGLGE